MIVAVIGASADAAVLAGPFGLTAASSIEAHTMSGTVGWACTKGAIHVSVARVALAYPTNASSMV